MKIGGGFKEHDLSDLTLFWMAVCSTITGRNSYLKYRFKAQIGDMLSLDVKYLIKGVSPTAPWGAQPYHE